MLNRIAVSGGSYDDWIGAVYDNFAKWRAESPVYCGGLSKEVVFTEVISNAATAEEPLGTLAGKGIMSEKHKGGHVVSNSATEKEPLGSLAGRGSEGRRKGGQGLRIKCEEPSLIRIVTGKQIGRAHV